MGSSVVSRFLDALAKELAKLPVEERKRHLAEGARLLEERKAILARGGEVEE